MEAAVEVRNLNKRYQDGTWANRDITLTIARGELLAILGPNGAGKTTLVRQITTELVPTSGEIRVFGFDGVSRPNEVKGYMGVIPVPVRAGDELLLGSVGPTAPAHLRQTARSASPHGLMSRR